MITVLQSLPAREGEWQVGSLVVSKRAKWIIRKITTHPEDDDKALVYMTRPNGQKIHLALFVETRRGWVMVGEPVPLPS